MPNILPLAVFLTFMAAIWSPQLLAQTADCRPADQNVEKTLASAKVLRYNGKYDQASALVDQAQTQAPNNSRVLYHKGLILADQQKYQDAEKVLQEALSVQQSCEGQPSFKQDYTLYNSLGWVQMVNGNSKGALTNFQTALDHKDALTGASLGRTESNLGYLYFSAGQFEQAKPLLEDASKLPGNNADETLKMVNRAEALYADAKKTP